MLKFAFMGLWLLLSGCSGISLLSGSSLSDLYTEDFLVEIEAIKLKYRQGQSSEALGDLQKMGEETLLPSERALRRNLIGVILFSEERFEQAIYNFDLALTTSRLDRPLTAQIYLNLASSYYKMGLSQKAYSALGQAEFRLLQGEESRKFHRLNFQLANELDRPKTQITSLIWYLADKENVTELRDEPYYQELLDRYFKLERSEQLRTLNEFDRDPFFIVGYLAYLTIERFYYQGAKNEAEGLMTWIERRFDDGSDIRKLLSQFMFRAESFSQMNQYSIGVVLPLSGEKKAFGERALKGIDSSLQKILGARDPETGASTINYELHVRDSQGLAPVGAFQVKELIEKKNVSVIIGGLFSEEAHDEYLEAKKYGVFYISLAEVYLPKDLKDPLLLEIPGSVESQMAHLFSDESLRLFGKRGAIVYPATDRGESYVSEFWRKAPIHGVSIGGLASYQPGQADFRLPIEGLLGLKYKRERQEEFDFMSEVYALEGRRSARRVQVLRPQIDFDWVFLAAFPTEALQLVPYFSYYDASRLRLIGGPSWRSQALAREGQRHGKLIFIGDDLSSADGEFTQRFTQTYGKPPMLIELRANDALAIAHQVLGERTFASRDEFTFALRDRDGINGMTGRWALEDNIWIKRMKAFQIRRGKIEGIENTPEEPEETTEEQLMEMMPEEAV